MKIIRFVQRELKTPEAQSILTAAGFLFVLFWAMSVLH